MTYDDYSNLTPTQRTKLNEFHAIGVAYAKMTDGISPPPDISTVTDQQAKSAANWLRDVAALNGPTEAGVQYVRQHYRDNVVKDYEDSVVVP